jgi:translation initiation factor 2B subunit (eIF-2B alpha/beta/delta family)
MQVRSWRKGLARAGGAALLLTIPAVALLSFTPTAFSAFRATTPRASTAAPASQAVAANAQIETLLTQWTETQDVVTQARRQSTSLNNALRQIRNQINSLNPNDPQFNFKFQFIQQVLLLIASQRDTWDTTWRRIGRPGADIVQLQDTLIELQVTFVSQNSALAVHQAQEIASGTISTFTPPSS